MATSTPVIEANKEDDVALARILYIYYALCICKNKKNKVQALINFSNKVNVMIPANASKLDLKICCINVKTQKIDGSTFKILKIVLASFQVENKLEKAWFF